MGWATKKYDILPELIEGFSVAKPSCIWRINYEPMNGAR